MFKLLYGTNFVWNYCVQGIKIHLWIYDCDQISSPKELHLEIYHLSQYIPFCTDAQMLPLVCDVTNG